MLKYSKDVTFVNIFTKFDATLKPPNDFISISNQDITLQ